MSRSGRPSPSATSSTPSPTTSSPMRTACASANSKASSAKKAAIPPRAMPPSCSMASASKTRSTPASWANSRAARRSASSSPKPSSALPRSSSSTSPPTTSISIASTGCRITSPITRAPSSSSPTIATSSTASVPTSPISITKPSSCTPAATTTWCSKTQIRSRIEAQCAILRKLGPQLRGEPFVGYYYGKDEPSIHIPEGTPEGWGRYGRTMAKEVLEQYGYGRFAAPLPKEKSFLEDPNKPLRWIAYNRWMNDKFIASRCRLSQALHEADPGAHYSPANYWFMSGFQPYDFSRLAACSDLMECDPYASSAERNRGRGVFNHGFGAKFMSDLTGKPVRVIAQAFNYAGYDMSPEDLREWCSQSLRCGASAIDYYEMDSPRWTDPARWKMMLHLSSVITRMNHIALPSTADTAILYTLYTH